MMRPSWRSPRALQPTIAAAFVAAAWSRASLAAEEPVPPAQRSVDAALTLATLNPCLPRPDLVSDIEDFLERDTLDADVSIKVSETDQTPWFSITVPGAPATTRAFSDLPSDCAEARRVVALSIALAIDAIAPATEHSDGRPQWALLAYGVLATDFPDKIGYGGGLSLRAPLSRWFSPSIGAVAFSADSERAGLTPALQYSATLVLARVEGCFTTPPRGTLQVALCVGPVFGAFRTSPSGLERSHPSTTFWPGAVAALELHVRLSRFFFVHLGADALVSAKKTRVQIDDSDGSPAFSQQFPWVSALFRVGPGFSF